MGQGISIRSFENEILDLQKRKEFYDEFDFYELSVSVCEECNTLFFSKNQTVQLCQICELNKENFKN